LVLLVTSLVRPLLYFAVQVYWALLFASTCPGPLIVMDETVGFGIRHSFLSGCIQMFAQALSFN